MSEPLPPAGAAPADPAPEPTPGAPVSGRALSYFPTEAADGADHSYRSLSLMALLGFTIGAVYAAIIILMAIVGFFAGKPLIVATWVSLIPLAAALMCWFARVQIRRSEGTLAGAGLATWGLFLSVFVAVGYLAYSSAVYFAIRQQAQRFATDWFKALKDDRADQAGFYTLEPLKRSGLTTNDPNLSQQVEIRSGMLDDPRNPRSLINSLKQMIWVRLLEQGGAETTIEPRGVSDWSYVRGGYEVKLNYNVRNPNADFDMILVVHGSEAPHQEFQGRQWYVDWRASGFSNMDQPVRYTQKGQALIAAAQPTGVFMREWLGKLMQRDKFEAFLETLPEEERMAILKKIPEGEKEKVAQAYRRAEILGALGAGPVAVASVLDPSLLPRYRRFVEGGLVELDHKRFSGDSTLEKDLLSEVQGMFSDRPVVPPVQPMPGQSMPQMQQKGDVVQVHYDIGLSGQARFSAEAVLTIEAETKGQEQAGAPPRLRVAGLRVVSGNKVSERPGDKVNERPGDVAPPLPRPRP